MGVAGRIACLIWGHFLMFEETRLLGTPKECIQVQTRKKRNLENWVAPPPHTQAINFYKRFRETYGATWLPRKPATGVYNCAGMVWASRRTCLSDPTDWRVILEDDEYSLVDQQEDLKVGDIAVYRKKDDKEILHVGRICDVERIEHWPNYLVSVLSKWSAQHGEDIHLVDNVPPLNGGEPFDVEFWTDRT